MSLTRSTLGLALPLLCGCGRQPEPPEKPHDPPRPYTAPVQVAAPPGSGSDAAASAPAVDVDRAIAIGLLLAERGHDPAVLVEQGIAEADWLALLAAVNADPVAAARYAAAIGAPGGTAPTGPASEVGDPGASGAAQEPAAAPDPTPVANPG